MANCASCGQMVLFGGIKHGSLRFCNKHCYDAAGYLQVVEQLPDDVVEETLTNVHQGDCLYVVVGRDRLIFIFRTV